MGLQLGATVVLRCGVIALVMGLVATLAPGVQQASEANDEAEATSDQVPPPEDQGQISSPNTMHVPDNKYEPSTETDVTALRTKHSRTWMHDDNQFVTEVVSKPIHTGGTGEELKKIRPTLNIHDDDTITGNERHAASVKVPTNLRDKPVSVTDNDSGRTIEMMIKIEGSAPGEIGENRAKYTNELSGVETDIEAEVSGSTVAMTFQNFAAIDAATIESTRKQTHDSV